MKNFMAIAIVFCLILSFFASLASAQVALYSRDKSEIFLNVSEGNAIFGTDIDTGRLHLDGIFSTRKDVRIRGGYNLFRQSALMLTPAITLYQEDGGSSEDGVVKGFGTGVILRYQQAGGHLKINGSGDYSFWQSPAPRMFRYSGAASYEFVTGAGSFEPGIEVANSDFIVAAAEGGSPVHIAATLRYLTPFWKTLSMSAAVGPDIGSNGSGIYYRAGVSYNILPFFMGKPSGQ